MKPEIKAAWVTALRGGEYEQGKDYLRQNDTYCCLGVLCDLAAREGVGTWREEDEVFVASGDRFDTGLSLLPTAVIRWADLPDANPRVTFEGDQNALSALNDTGTPFAEIADLIEDQL